MNINNLNPALPRIRNRLGMTLVEILVVISIIALLAGLLLPVIGAVRRRGQVTATVLEIQNLNAAIEQYKQKFGDYPPDGSNSVVLKRHIRIAFPRIAKEEFDDFMILVTDSDEPSTTILEAPEALVFFLGGFSDDPRYPFTGTGGPLTGNRNPGIFDFDPARLTTTSYVTINLDSGRTVTALASDDDETYNTGHGVNDIFAVYKPKGADVPFVYLDSRTYMSRTIYSYNNTLVDPAQYPPLHRDGPPNITGTARPYRSDEPRQPTPADSYAYKWVNPTTFQIIAAGLDNDFGKNPQYKHYPSGGNYTDGDNSNITSFSRGTLEDDIP
ncbi:MAG: prepilin-type N-terminal cleavage/methylation domain-containing protein [Planctomycetaceae bacterium]|nr:prepilin-type N-terminal cleavage/methylation domain-containing protein [Planctomycetaceae bacterium]